MPKVIEIKRALTELRAFAQQMGFGEAAEGLTAALDRVPADKEDAVGSRETPKRDGSG